jgi:hypothetical protein
MGEFIMRKSIIMALAVIFLLGLPSSALAAGEAFSDVPAKHWAYGAISQLSRAGIIDGYGDGTFRGEKTLTRYEMAMLVANAMTKSAKADAQNKALIEKLAKEFDSELVKLGARVSALEADKPKIKIGGQARFSYAYRNDAVADPWYGTNPHRHDFFTYRLRLEGTAQLSDRVTFFTRLRAQDYDVETGAQNPASGATATSGTFSSTRVEIFKATWKKPFDLNNTTLTLGRDGLAMGKNGVVFTVGDDDIVAFDTVTKDYNFKVGIRNHANGVVNDNRELLLQIGAKLSDWGNFQLYNVKGMESLSSTVDIYGLALDAKLGQGLSLFGEYAKNQKAANNNKTYWFGITNGNTRFHPDMAMLAPWGKVGASAQAFIVRRHELNAINIADSQLQTTLGNATTNGCLWLWGTKGYEFWDQHNLDKNISLLITLGTASKINGGSRLTNYGMMQFFMFF